MAHIRWITFPRWQLPAAQHMRYVRRRTDGPPIITRGDGNCVHVSSRLLPVFAHPSTPHLTVRSSRASSLTGWHDMRCRWRGRRKFVTVEKRGQVHERKEPENGLGPQLAASNSSISCCYTGAGSQLSAADAAAAEVCHTERASRRNQASLDYLYGDHHCQFGRFVSFPEAALVRPSSRRHLPGRFPPFVD